VLWILLRLDASGKPLESEVWPIIPESQCVRDSLLALRFPPPPRSAFWIQVEIRR